MSTAMQKSMGSWRFLPLERTVRLKRDVNVGPYKLAAGMTGVVREELAPRIIDYRVECPIQFEKEDLPKTMGVPWDSVEFADVY